ncbi:MAG: ABC transporter permease [Bacteroidia bacterium]|nr:ABC transporter permease [Bacteroidia bacterium]MDW8333457.1 ABC transporter permease [Bacteroidia bacterium]
MRAIRANWLRSTLTVLIIAFGITAIVGVLTAIDGLKQWMTRTFVTLGANTFKIENRGSPLRIGQGRKNPTFYAPITLRQATMFQKRIEGVAVASVDMTASWSAKAKYQNRETFNNLQLRGSDERFLDVEAYELEEGRALNEEDVRFGRKVVVVGAEIKNKLFPQSSPLGKTVYIEQKHYQVVGVFKERGTAFGSGGDKIAVIPVTTLMHDFPDRERSAVIHVLCPDAQRLSTTIETATGIMRTIRKVRPGKPNTFSISLADGIVNNLMENLAVLTLSATAIAAITLVGAAIGLMNIMIVSVTERTMEIGVRKAMGATRRHILIQFLTEALVIGQLGGLSGVIFGVAVGNLVGYVLGSGVIVPWAWMALAFLICFAVGLAAGVYPAMRAAKVEPIESLRYE